MLIPGIMLVMLFSIIPMAGIVMAFQKYNPVKGMFHSEWIGLDNIRFMLINPESAQIFKNTVIIALLKMTAGLLVPIVFALMLNELRVLWFKRVIQTVVYLPHFLSWVIIAGIIKDILSYNGVVNVLLGYAGFEPIKFMGSSVMFRPLLVVTDVWKEFGFSAVIYLAALTGISPHLYEAAEIDGATRMQKLRYITLPGIAATVVLLATLSLQNVLNAGFDQVFNLYNPLVYSTGDIIDTYVYRSGLEQGNYEVATAIGLFKSVISFVLIIAAYHLAKRFAGYKIF
ncbi:protein lplB [Paenibacillus swuensis]|uniref:Protein lplB n=1 Tax=Paenibacillus swuensis TaxID=1178515 RepID=A0A172TPD1_9BACL|nr:ABC transporter permease subunit [Paenibacillus swuensis]ANE48898.1 protein lplB [Paenibacillus swuensis]